MYTQAQLGICWSTDVVKFMSAQLGPLKAHVLGLINVVLNPTASIRELISIFCSDLNLYYWPEKELGMNSRTIATTFDVVRLPWIPKASKWTVIFLESHNHTYVFVFQNHWSSISPPLYLLFG